MCLLLEKEAKRQIAKKDIVVYKHIIRTDENGYVSSYQYSPIEFGKVLTSGLIREEGVVNIGFHSYGDKEITMSEGKLWKEVVVKCIIPKGSAFYKGWFSSFISYASDKIIYKEVIADFQEEEEGEE